MPTSSSGYKHAEEEEEVILWIESEFSEDQKVSKITAIILLYLSKRLHASTSLPSY